MAMARAALVIATATALLSPAPSRHSQSHVNRRRGARTGFRLRFSAADDAVAETADDADQEARWASRRRSEMLESPETLTADAVNDLYGSPTGAARHLQDRDPDRWHGAIFRLEGVVADLGTVYHRTWCGVAEEFDLEPPTLPEVLAAMDLSPELAVQQRFQWTFDWAEARKYAWYYSEKLGETLVSGGDDGGGVPATEAIAGVEAWLRALQAAGVPCACVSQMATADATRLLAALELGGLFSGVAGADLSDGRDSQALLVAALMIERPPNKCAAFDVAPRGLMAAHEADMRAVAVLSGVRVASSRGGARSLCLRCPRFSRARSPHLPPHLPRPTRRTSSRSPTSPSPTCPP